MKQDFYLQAGQSLQSGLRFRARSAIVTSPGGVWIGLPDVGAYVAPWTAGAVVPLPGTSVANVSTTPPSGQQNSGTGAPSVVTFTSDRLAAFAGNNLVPNLAPQTGTPLQPSEFLGPPVGGLSWSIPDGTVLSGNYYLDDVHLNLYGGSGGAFITAVAQIQYQGAVIAQGSVVGGPASGSGTASAPWVANYANPRVIPYDGLHSLTTVLNFGSSQVANSCVVVYAYGLRKQVY